VSGSASDVERLIRLLRTREQEGEGSRYDRLRAERELTELRVDTSALQSSVAATAARLAAFLPEGERVLVVRGDLQVAADVPALDDLVRRATAARADYRMEQRNVERYRIEERAARRLRIPEPQISAGLKRADEFSGAQPNPFSTMTKSGLAIGLSIPLPIFNRGNLEVARYRAEQEQAGAHLAVLARQIRAEIAGALGVLGLRRAGLAAYRRDLESAGAELTQITQVAYQEGEIGILEVLDSLRVSRASRLRLIELEAGVKEAAIELDRVVGEEVHP